MFHSVPRRSAKKWNALPAGLLTRLFAQSQASIFGLHDSSQSNQQ
ncbi:MAG: hypothetical protein JWR09_827 [Mucilaginibacter sp.]|nr:hypothetical protein [Mucilaginibacter sp.]